MIIICVVNKDIIFLLPISIIFGYYRLLWHHTWVTYVLKKVYDVGKNNQPAKHGVIVLWNTNTG